MVIKMGAGVADYKTDTEYIHPQDLKTPIKTIKILMFVLEDRINNGFYLFILILFIFEKRVKLCFSALSAMTVFPRLLEVDTAGLH